MKPRLPLVPVMTAAVAAATFALYLATVAPGITWSSLGADGGDLLSAAFTWGIPHPSGYPTYLLALRAFATLVPIGEPAFRGNLMSATSAALASALVFVAAARVALAVSRYAAAGMPGARPVARWVPVGAATIAALGAGAAREFWSQATITEVYALNAFFFAVILAGSAALLVRESPGRRDRWIVAGLAFALGVGLGNHLTLALAGGPLVAFAVLRWWNRNGRGARNLVLAVAPFAVGLAVYLYAPIASIQRPPVNWGHPHTPQGFWWMVSGSIYRDYAFGIETRLLPGRIATWADFFLSQYSLVGLWLALAGLYVLGQRFRRFALYTVVAVLLVSLYAVGYNTPDSYLYLIPAFLVFAVWIASGITWAAAAVHAYVAARWHVAWPAVAVVVVLLAVAAAIPGFSLYSNLARLNLRNDHGAQEFARGAFESAGPDSVILASDTERVFALWYQAYVAEPAANIAVVSVPHLQFDWYWDDLRRQFPERVPEVPPAGFNARVDALIGHNLGARPIFAATRMELLDRYTLTPKGVIFDIGGLR
ncbi:MAG: DUF2723 domain-containing protein [Chloroflexi bacterium]|nr:DUF2723 domain-containing protein [Chloroflexota bacterium]